MKRNRKRVFIVYMVGLVVVTLWIAWTPDGVESKLKAIGYAFCHQIPSHSLTYGERVFPLCARCTGMYLGALMGILVQYAMGKRSGGISKKALVIWGIWSLAFILDGINSLMELFLRHPLLYPPQNWLRFVTGWGAGILIAAIVYPMFVQSIWRNWRSESALDHSIANVVIMAGGSLFTMAIFINKIPVMVLLALLSVIGVLITLLLVYTTLLVVIFKQENRFHGLAEAFPMLIGGLIATIGQIGVNDLIRYSLTNTWNGLPF